MKNSGNQQVTHTLFRRRWTCIFIIGQIHQIYRNVSNHIDKRSQIIYTKLYNTLILIFANNEEETNIKLLLHENNFKFAWERVVTEKCCFKTKITKILFLCKKKCKHQCWSTTSIKLLILRLILMSLKYNTGYILTYWHWFKVRY